MLRTDYLVDKRTSCKNIATLGYFRIMETIADLLSYIASAGKIITDAANWSLTVENPYVRGVHGAQAAATIDTVTTPDDTSLSIAFTYSGTQYTVVAAPGGGDASISIDGANEPNARMVLAGIFPINVDFRPVTLTGSAPIVRLNFKFDMSI